jgi:hypothetical protein
MATDATTRLNVRPVKNFNIVVAPVLIIEMKRAVVWIKYAPVLLKVVENEQQARNAA